MQHVIGASIVFVALVGSICKYMLPKLYDSQ